MKFVNVYKGLTASRWLNDPVNRRRALSALWEANQGKPISCYRSSEVLREALPGANDRFVSQITNRLSKHSYITGAGSEQGRTGYWSLTSRGNKEVAAADKVPVITSPPSPSGERKWNLTGESTPDPLRPVQSSLAEKMISYIRSSQKLPSLRQEIDELESKLTKLRVELAECESVVSTADELEKELAASKLGPHQPKN